jgi:hypothetical protein
MKAIIERVKCPSRKRPLRREVARPVGVDLVDLARRVTYVGSPEHKSTRSFAGHPRPRATASICDPSLAKSQEQVTIWLREAVELGYLSALWEDGFPRYIWREIKGQPYEARLVNSGLGEYKGYPLLEDQWPEGVARP